MSCPCPLAHVAGVPVEEALPYVVPVAGVWLAAAGGTLRVGLARWRRRRTSSSLTTRTLED